MANGSAMIYDICFIKSTGIPSHLADFLFFKYCIAQKTSSAFTIQKLILAIVLLYRHSVLN